MRQAEQMIEIYHEAEVVCRVLATCFLAVAVVFFFWFRIPGALDFLSGNLARRSIERMKKEAAGQETGVSKTTVFLKERRRREEYRKKRGKTGKTGGIWLLILVWLLWGGTGECAQVRPDTQSDIQPDVQQELETVEDGEDSDKDASDPEDADQEPPVVQAVWFDKEGNCLEDSEYSRLEELVLELTIQEEHFDRDGTTFYLTAGGRGGGRIECPEAELVDGKSWGELWEEVEDNGDESEEGENERPVCVELAEREGIYTMRLHLRTEADYTFSAIILDEAGNQAGDGEKVVLGFCCLDRTAPQIRRKEDGVGRPAGDMVWSAKEQTFFRKLIHGLSFGYFCKPVLEVRIGAWDPISGIGSITYECEGRFGDEEEIRVLTKTASWDNGLLKGAEEGQAYTILELPDSFRGVVRARAEDQAGNVMDSWSESVGLLAESDAMHEKNSGVSVAVLEGKGKKEGFYQGDVKLRFDFRDEFSGIRKAQLRAGTQEMSLSFEEEGEEVVTCTSQELTLLAGENNGNHVPIEAVLTDFAGHTAETAVIPEIHVDTKAPEVSVEWSNLDVRNEKYYNGDRVATITVTERNFDPEDIQVELKGMEAPTFQWRHEPGGGCGGSADPFDTGHTDACRWMTQLAFDKDGEYAFGFSCRDAAGNIGSWGRTEEFVIDKTAPVISVEWNPAQARHEKYFAKERVAVVEVAEQNFRAEDAAVEILAFDTERDVQALKASAFQKHGEVWRAQARFDVEGRFQLRASCTDLAGNEALVYLSEEFILDLTPPEIAFFGVENRSANHGTVMPGLHIKDANRDPDSCQIELAGSSGTGTVPEYTWKEWEREVFVRWEDFAYVPENDDLYRIRAVACDLAGNQTVEELFFSVNRFGSVYVLEEETKRLAGASGVRYTNQEPELVVEEYNGDFLEAKQVFVSRDGEVCPMEEGRDYTVEMSGNEDSWKQYRYRIPGKNFTEEGAYLVALHSKDQASNYSSSGMKEKSMEFVVDKTGPDIVLANVENEGEYKGRSRRIRIDIQDPGGVREAKLYRNGVCDRVWSREELMEGQGLLTYTVPEADGWQTVQVWAWDAAGNEGGTEKLKVLVMEERVICFWERRGWQVLIVGIGAAAIGLFWLVRQRKKEVFCGRVEGKREK